MVNEIHIHKYSQLGLDKSLTGLDKFPKVTKVNFKDKTFIDILNNENHPEYPKLRSFN